MRLRWNYSSDLWSALTSKPQVLALICFALVVSLTGIPRGVDAPIAQENPTGNSQEFAADEFIIRYVRLSGEEAVGLGIASEHAQVAELALKGLHVAPEQLRFDPLYPEVFDTMRKEGLNENLALLSLIKKHGVSSRRFVESSFFAQLQGRRSLYGFSRNFIVRSAVPLHVPQILEHITKQRRFFRSQGFFITAFPVRLSSIVGNRVDAESSTGPVQTPMCSSLPVRVAIIGDQFQVRKDLPMFSQISLIGTQASGCDSTPYAQGNDSYGTNLAGVVSALCPTCSVLGVDAGCAKNGGSVIRTTEATQAILTAILKDVAVLLFTTADTKSDPVYEEAISAAISAGVALVAPAGDNSSTSAYYPAATKGVISVAAQNNAGATADFSNSGSWVTTSAKGVAVSTSHGTEGFLSLSSSSLAAARVAALLARHLAVNEMATPNAILAKAGAGSFAEPSPQECPVNRGGAGGGTGATDKDSGGTPDGSQSSSGGGNGGGSSGVNGGGGSGAAGNSPSDSSQGGDGNSGKPGGQADGNSQVNAVNPLATFAFPSTMSPADQGVSPFEIRKIWAQLKSQGVRTGVVSSNKSTKAIYVTSSNQTRVDLVYQDDSAAARFVTNFPGKINQPLSLGAHTRQSVVTLLVDKGTDIQKTFANLPGVIGVSASDKPHPNESSAAIRVSEASMSSTDSDNSAALTEMGWHEGVREFTEKFTEKVKVAVISTGIDYTNKAFQGAVTGDLRVTDASGASSGDDPMDKSGFGTQVASLLAHEKYGVARKYIELLPIKIFAESTASPERVRAIVGGIAFAVNRGAEVIVLPHDFNVDGCDPVVGHAIARARDKGSFIVVTGGDGRLTQAGAKLGYPVVAAREDGPASYELTSNPACWSRYFLGAVSFAASEGFAKPLPEYANYGDDIELAAFGGKVTTVGLRDKVVTAKGSAFSAAWGAAAAAMAIAHHKTHKMSYGPWLLENYLVESANRDPNSAQTERRVRFGSFISFQNLQQLLTRTETMTDEERRNIRTIGRHGDGWKPGQIANLRYVTITLDKAVAKPGDEFGYRVLAFLRSGEVRDVTNDTANTTISLQASEGKQYLRLVRPGVIAVADESAFKFFKGKPVFAVSANYLFEQAQGFDNATIRVALKPEDRRLEKLTIRLPNTPIRTGAELNLLALTATYIEVGGSRQEETVTKAASWRTSDPNELRFSAPGVLDARDATSGKSYTIFADFEGKTAELTVVIEPEELRQLYIHSYLGRKAEKGQKVPLEARMILRRAGEGTTTKDREQMIDAVWYQDNSLLNGGAKARLFTLDTANLRPGLYTFTAKATLKSPAESREVTASFQLQVLTEVKYIEIHAKQSIAQVNQPFFIDLRAYRPNNSYSVVTEDAQWASDAPDFVSINKYGVGFIRPGFNPRTVAITATYKGHTARLNLAIIIGSVVTGSSSLIDYLTMRVEFRYGLEKYCEFPGVRVTATYKDRSERSSLVRTISFSEQRADGSWGSATLPLYGGRIYRASAAYNDGSQATGGGGESIISATFEMPKEKLDLIKFDVLDRDKPDEIFRDAQSKTFFTASGVCSLKDNVQISPVTQTTARVTGRMVLISPRTLGVHKVTAQGIFTGMGQQELKEGYFTIDVKDTKPESVVLRRVPVNTSLNGPRSVEAYGSNVFDVLLLDNNKRQINFRGADLEVSLKQGGRLIEPKTSERVWWEFTENIQSPSNRVRFTMHAYPKSFGEQSELTVTHKPSGLSAKLGYTAVGSWESSDKPAANLPSLEQPTPTTSVHPSCIEYAKNPTNLEFAGGTGTEVDPVIICNATQLMSYGGNFLFSDTQYCKKTGKCRGIPNPSNPTQRLYIAMLGDSIDFKGAKISPIQFGWVHDAHVLDGGMHSISNYVIVDSEQSYVGLFASRGGSKPEFRNLIIINPVVRGNSEVASLYGALNPVKLQNVTVIGGTVWGNAFVGGAVVSGQDLRNVRVFGTEVRYEGYRAGGIASMVANGSELLFTGSVASAGVPGNTHYIGGITGVATGRISEVLMTGSVITLGSWRSVAGVGGIAGVTSRGIIVNAVMRGNVVCAGAGVGGVVGILRDGSFGLDQLKPFTPETEDLTRSSAIIGAQVSGNIWGGMSRKELECIDQVAQILGVGGSTNCIGDIKTQKDGRSDVGGIVGANYGGLVQDSVFSGTVRGVSAVGGVAGYDTQVSNYVRNICKGTASASEGVSDYGAIVGLSESLKAQEPTFVGHVVSRFDGNTIVQSEGNPSWAIGKLDNQIASPMTSNVPDYFGR